MIFLYLISVYDSFFFALLILDLACQEKISCAKLMVSLMACEDAVVESLSSGLLEAKSALAAISSADCSPELQQLCRKLLSCITSPLDDVLRHLSTSYMSDRS